MRNPLQLIHVPARRVSREIERYRLHFAKCLLGGKYRVTAAGLIIDDALHAAGSYFHRLNERESDFTWDPNLVPGQGIATILAITFTDTAKIPKFYLGLTNGAAVPGDGLTAASFAATQGEIVSTSEGYTSATRPQWVPGAPVAGVVSSDANKATFTFASAASVTVTGCGLLSDNGRGSTAGVLMSATKFDNARTAFNGETITLGYQVSLTD
jgi:hypothetical protein